MYIKKAFYIVTGSIALILGTIGAFLPLIPTVPLYLLAAFCYARSSRRMHEWFTGTKMYKKHLEDYVNGQGMTIQTKAKIMITITISIGIGFYFMDEVPIARVIVAIIWLCLMVYFGLIVKRKA